MDNQQVEPYLILGCFGREEDGFVLCPSCENKILKIDDGLDDFTSLIEFFNSCQLFDRPSSDYNAIKNILQLLEGRFFRGKYKLWSQKELDSIQKFIIMHKTCGLFLKLEMTYPKVIEAKEEKPVFIQAQSKKLLLKKGNG